MSNENSVSGRVERVRSLTPHTRGTKLPNLPTLPAPIEATETERQTYTVAEVAKILGIGRNTAYECCKSGEIPTIRIGGRILVSRNAIDALLDGVA
ncbi:MAG: helix-turn-helix domain-containing protein [Acidimicrobiales bacterium]